MKINIRNSTIFFSYPSGPSQVFHLEITGFNHHYVNSVTFKKCFKMFDCSPVPHAGGWWQCLSCEHPLLREDPLPPTTVSRLGGLFYNTMPHFPLPTTLTAAKWTQSQSGLPHSSGHPLLTPRPYSMALCFLLGTDFYANSIGLSITSPFSGPVTGLGSWSTLDRVPGLQFFCQVWHGRSLGSLIM